MVGKGFTRGDILYYALAHCLRGVRLYVGRRHLKPDLTEVQRYQVAAQMVELLRRQGWKELDDHVEPAGGTTGVTPSQR